MFSVASIAVYSANTLSMPYLLYLEINSLHVQVYMFMSISLNRLTIVLFSAKK